MRVDRFRSLIATLTCLKKRRRVTAVSPISLSQCSFSWFVDRHFRTLGHHPPVGTYFLCALPVGRRRITMNKQDSISWKKLEQRWVSRRNLIRGAAGAALGTGLLRPASAYAGHEDDDRGCRGPILNPIPGGAAPFKPFGVMIHHNPLNPAIPLANISDPSQIND